MHIFRRVRSRQHFQNIIAESGAAQKEAEKEIWKQIKEKYGALIGEPASEDELKEIKQLYIDYHKLKGSVRKERADKVIAKFKELQPRSL